MFKQKTAFVDIGVRNAKTSEREDSRISANMLSTGEDASGGIS
jgi:hypothetical protein